MVGDWLSLPGLTGCIQGAAGGVTLLLFLQESLLLNPFNSKPNSFVVIYTSIANGPDFMDSVEVGAPEEEAFINAADITPGTPIRFVTNGSQTGGSAATSFQWLVESTDPGAATVNGGPSAIATTENCPDGAISIIYDPAVTDQFDINITYTRTNSAGSGISYDGPQPIFFRPN